MKLKNYITIYGTLLLVIAIIWTIPLAGYLAGKMSREDARLSVGLLIAVICMVIIFPLLLDASDYYLRKRKEGTTKIAQ